MSPSGSPVSSQSLGREADGGARVRPNQIPSDLGAETLCLGRLRHYDESAYFRKGTTIGPPGRNVPSQTWEKFLLGGGTFPSGLY